MSSSSASLEHHQHTALSRKPVKSIMTPAVPTAPDTATIGDIEQNLFKNISDFRSINYTYILDRQHKLVGIISIKELFRYPKETKAVKVMRTGAVTIHPDADREHASRLAVDHSIKAVPVTDSEGIFLGVVLSDAIMRTLREESHADLFGLAGIRHTEAITDTHTATLFDLFRHRLPWLLAGIAGSLLAAGFIGQFESTLKENIIVAAFIPLVVYISSAVAEQTQAFVIRDLAINPSLRFRPYFLRQTAIAFFLGITISLLLFFIGMASYGSAVFGFVLASSTFLAVLSSIGTGFIFPYFAQRVFRIDPANAGGPIAQVVQDVSAILIYFSIAAWWL